ncbi:MAG: SpoIVB peptidase [Lachnospiraceae bacterium]
MSDINKKVIRCGKKRKVYRGCLICALIVTCFTLAGVWSLSAYKQIPGNIKLKLGEELVWNIELPVAGEIVKIGEKEELQAVAVNGQNESNIPAGSIHIDLREPVTMRADSLSSYQMNLKLFGIIPFKQVNVDVIENRMLTPVGLPVGIYLKTDGVLIIGIGDYIALDGSKVSPAEYVLKSGDYILKVDGEAVSDKNTFIQTVEDSEGKPLVLTIRRGEEEFDVKVVPIQNQNGDYKLGIWVRDNAQGVGTMTFVDEQGNFGALGHGINDVDTSLIMQLDSGTLYKTDIIAIKKGTKGDPGEMTGMIDYSDKNILGIITDNTEKGIFGSCNETMLSRIEAEPLPIGLKQEVEAGPAQILCTVDGEPAYYDIVIKEVHLDNSNVNKGIVLQVTDPELIALTGGIVQGMSGAPIIQNGKIVGAVTHVLINDATSGYGIFIENMLEQ